MERVDRVAAQLLAVVALLFCLVGTFSFLVDIVLPDQYDTVKYMVAATIAAPLLYTLSEVTGIGINITRRTAWSVGATLTALVVCVLTNVVLVPSLGARGAVIATVVAYVAFMVTRTEASRRLWRPFPRVHIYVAMLSLCGLACATVLLGPQTGRWYCVIWAALIPVVLFVFRHEWPEMARALRNAGVPPKSRPRLSERT